MAHGRLDERFDNGAEEGGINGSTTYTNDNLNLRLNARLETLRPYLPTYNTQCREIDCAFSRSLWELG